MKNIVVVEHIDGHARLSIAGSHARRWKIWIPCPDESVTPYLEDMLTDIFNWVEGGYETDPCKCGGAAQCYPIFSGAWAAFCVSCGVEGPCCRTAERAVRAWNRGRRREDDGDSVCWLCDIDTGQAVALAEEAGFRFFSLAHPKDPEETCGLYGYPGDKDCTSWRAMQVLAYVLSKKGGD